VEREKETPEEPTLNQQVIHDVAEKVPFHKTFKLLFFRDKKFVKEGFLVFLLIAVLSAFAGYKWEKSRADSEMAGVRQGNEKMVNQLKGELSATKQDRDKYQILLAPYEAYALAKYTNAPIDQRLELLTAAMLSFTNQFNADKPILGLQINGQTINPLAGNLKKGDDLYPNATIQLSTNREISIVVVNDSEATAEHITVDFFAGIDVTNVVANGWLLEVPGANNVNNWRITAEASFGQFENLYLGQYPIKILPNYKKQFLTAHIRLHSDRSKTFMFVVLFVFPN